MSDSRSDGVGFYRSNSVFSDKNKYIKNTLNHAETSLLHCLIFLSVFEKSNMLCQEEFWSFFIADRNRQGVSKMIVNIVSRCELSLFETCCQQLYFNNTYKENRTNVRNFLYFFLHL